MTGSEAEDQLRRLERARCQAISSLNIPELEELLDSELTHTHVNGLTQDRAAYLAALPARRRSTTPGEISVRVLGDIALMTGTIVNTFERADGTADSTELHALRVWRRAEGGAWRLIAFGASGPIGAPSVQR